MSNKEKNANLKKELLEQLEKRLEAYRKSIQFFKDKEFRRVMDIRIQEVEQLSELVEQVSNRNK